MQDISGKTAIVTGAASGIGLGIATALAEAGANVVMADIQKDAVEEAAHRLSGTNKRVMPVRIDVTLEQSIIDALSEAEKNFGKLHIACNNAGVPMHGTPHRRCAARRLAIRHRRQYLGHHPRHPPFRARDPEARRGRARRQHRLGRRLPEPPRHQSGAVFDEQIRRPVACPRRWSTSSTAPMSASRCCVPGPINTNIARGARNRPEHMGGPLARANDEAVLAERLATTGLDPKTVGERVVDAIRTKTFYAFVGAVPADVIRARHRRIEEALNSPWVTHY